METLGIVLFMALFLTVPVLFLAVAGEFYLLTRLVRQHHPELQDRLSGYGSYPGSTRHNLMRFVVGKGYEAVADEALARRCRRVRTLELTGLGVLSSGAFLTLVLGS